MRSLFSSLAGMTLIALMAGCQNPTSHGSSTASFAAATADPSASNWTAGGALPLSGYWNSLAYGNGVFVAVGNTNGQNAATSTDGMTWTSRAMPSLNDANLPWQAITFGNGKFVALPGNSNDTNTISAVSTDGVTWTTGTLPSASWKSVAYFNGQFVAASAPGGLANNAHLVTSTDGLTWTSVSLKAPSAGWLSVAGGNGLTVVAGNTEATVNDGQSWSVKKSFPVTGKQTALAFGNGTFVVLFDGVTTAANSADADTWTSRTLPASLSGPGLTYGYHTFVAVSRSNNLTSSDGVTWTTQTLPTSTYGWSAVASGNNRFVAISSFGSQTAVSQ